MSNTNYQSHSGSGDNVGRDKNIFVNLPKGLILVISIFLFLLIGFYLMQFVKDVDSIVNENSNIDIMGKWDTKKVDGIVFSQMQKYNSTGGGYNLRDIVSNEKIPIYHKIIDYYWVDLEGRQSYFVVAYSGGFDNEIYSTCHSCPAPISIFEFQKVEGGYKLINSYLDIEIMEGEYGEPPKEINILSIGFNKFGVEVKDEFQTSGEVFDLEIASIYTLIGDDFKNVLSVDLSSIEFYSRDVFFVSSMSIVKEGTGYYDIEISIKNLKEKTIEKEYYVFNGVEYILREKKAENKG